MAEPLLGPGWKWSKRAEALYSSTSTSMEFFPCILKFRMLENSLVRSLLLMYRVELALLIVQIFLKPLIVSVSPFFVPPYWFGCLSFALVRLGAIPTFKRSYGTGIPSEEMIKNKNHILACALSQPTVRKIWCLGKSKGGGDFSFYLSKLCGCTRDRDKLMVQCITNVLVAVVHLRRTTFKE